MTRKSVGSTLVGMTALAMALVVVSPRRAEAAKLTVEVEGLKEEGRLMVSVVDSAGAWSGKSKPVVAVDAKVVGESMRLVFDLPPGELAIRLFHDANGNGKLDRNMLGVPKEGYGFSQNPRVVGPAGFSDAKFALPDAGAVSRIKVR
ncbi:MAG: DUF2141 domain-containing protein [Myxococcota bacterium]